MQKYSSDSAIAQFLHLLMTGGGIYRIHMLLKELKANRRPLKS